MGKGHGNNNEPFDIETACYLKPIFAAYDQARRNRQRLFLVVFAGVKTMKSFAQEVCAADHVCNARGDAALFFFSGETADTGSTTRIMDYFKVIPRFAARLEQLRSRFDDTMGAVKFPDKTLFLLAANMGNTQQKNLAFVGLQDAFLTGTTGMIKEMEARTTQYAKECIIFLESQGGEKGDDFDMAYGRTDQRELYVKCPACERAHVFNWKAFDEQEMTRGDGFEAVLPKARVKEIEDRSLKFGLGEHRTSNEGEGNFEQKVTEGENESTVHSPQSTVGQGAGSVDVPSTADDGAARQHRPTDDDLRNPFSAVNHAIGFEIGFAERELSEALKKPERRVAGFKRGDRIDALKLDSKISEKGEINEAAVLKHTCFECFHCGSIWRDDGEFGPTRIALDRSAHYVAQRPDALACNVGFNIPQWINRRIGWGEIMLEKLQAHQTLSEFGNIAHLQKWWQKRAARAWSTDINVKAPEKLGATIYEIDPKVKLPGELVRIAGCDFQLNGTHLPYQAWAIGDGRRPRLLHWEWVKPVQVGLPDDQAREFCKKRVRELNKQWGIEQQNFMIDAAHRPDLVREWAAEDAVFARIRLGSRLTNKWVSYGLLIGDDRASYKWHHPGRASTLERFKQYEFVDVDIVKDGKRMRIPIHHRLWSNPSIKDIAMRWRDGDSAPKIEVHEKFLAETGKESFWSQMTSERKMPWKGRPGKMRYDNEGKPNHAWDGFCMVMVRMDELGYLNSFGPPVEEEKE
jgi:hypothetical protein